MENNKYSKLQNIYSFKKIKDFKEYIYNIREEYHNLTTTKEKNNFIKDLQKTTELYFLTIINRKSNIIYHNSGVAMANLIAKYLRMVKKKENFEIAITEILNIIENFTDKRTTKIITQKEIKNVFKTIYNIYPKLKPIFKRYILEIFLLNFTDSTYNSITRGTKSFNKFDIYCYRMKNNNIDHIYVFLHEIGHIICMIATNSDKKIPDDFIKKTNKCYKNLTPDNPDSLEVFADSFAQVIIHYSELNIFEPFNQGETQNKQLKNYFQNLIEKL